MGEKIEEYLDNAGNTVRDDDTVVYEGRESDFPNKNVIVYDEDLGCCPKWRIISRAQPSPARTVTTRTVPNQCVIGHVEVTNHGKIWMRNVTTPDELTEAIATLTTIRDAMQANTTA